MVLLIQIGNNFNFSKPLCGTNLFWLSTAGPLAPSSPRVLRESDFGETLLLRGALVLAVQPLRGPARGSRASAP